MEFSIAVLPGDGIGPEILDEAVRVLETVERGFYHKFIFKEALIGASAFEKVGEALPAATIETCKECDAVLFGAVGVPKYENTDVNIRPEAGYGLIRLRKLLGLFANIRPVAVIPSLIDSSCLKREVVTGVDFLIIRELTGGIYFGEPKGVVRSQRGRSAVDTLAYSEEEIVRVVKVGFELARSRRKKLTSVDKFRILSSSDLWREVTQEIASQYPDVTLEHALVDSCAVRLITDPGNFDVLVTENLFGDILSDEASAITGSLGMMPSASLADAPHREGRVFGLYEPIHGSAAYIAGMNAANPIAAILSAAMMLRYSFGLPKEAEAVEKAVHRVLEEGFRTRDIMSPGKTQVGTDKMGRLITRRISEDILSFP